METEAVRRGVHRGDELPRPAHRPGAGAAARSVRAIAGCSTSPAARGSLPARSPSGFPRCAPRCWRRRRSIGLPRGRSRGAVSATASTRRSATCSPSRCPAATTCTSSPTSLHDWDEDVVRQLLARLGRGAASGRPADRPRHLPECHQDRAAADRRVLGAADARHPGSLLFGRRDRVMADGGRVCLPGHRAERDRPERDPGRARLTRAPEAVDRACRPDLQVGRGA